MIPLLEAPDLPVSRLPWLLVPLLLVWLLLRRDRAPSAGRLPLAVLRATIQLSLIGYVLVPLFSLPATPIILLVLGVQCALASIFALTLVQRGLGPRLWLPALVAILPVVVGLVLFALGLMVPGVSPLDPRFAISLTGMLAGNAMNATALAGQRYLQALGERRAEIELCLAFGATGPEADRPLRAAAIEAAVTPSLGSMLAVGLVSLPGMMTGQVMGGGDPLVAARYQLMIRVLWLAAAALAPLVFLGLLSRGVIAEGRIRGLGHDGAWQRFETREVIPLKRRPEVYEGRPGGPRQQK